MPCMSPYGTQYGSTDSAAKTTIQWLPTENPGLGKEQFGCRTQVPDRGIRPEIAEEYGVRIGLDEETGEPAFHYYPYHKEGKLVAYKERNVSEKDFKIIGKGTGLELFGQNRIGEGGKLLIITEGELDALAATQMLKDRGKNHRVVSLPTGANTRSVRDNIGWLETFEHIFSGWFDQDQPGREASKEIAELLTPGKVKVMSFSEKDAADIFEGW